MDYLNGNVPVSQPDGDGCYRWMGINAGLTSSFCSPDDRPAITLIGGDLDVGGNSIENTGNGLVTPVDDTPAIVFDIGDGTPVIRTLYGKKVDNAFSYTFRFIIDDVMTDTDGITNDLLRLTVTPTLPFNVMDSQPGTIIDSDNLTGTTISKSATFTQWRDNELLVDLNFVAPVVPANSYEITITGIAPTR